MTKISCLFDSSIISGKTGQHHKKNLDISYSLLSGITLVVPLFWYTAESLLSPFMSNDMFSLCPNRYISVKLSDEVYTEAQYRAFYECDRMRWIIEWSTRWMCISVDTFSVFSSVILVLFMSVSIGPRIFCSYLWSVFKSIELWIHED